VIVEISAPLKNHSLFEENLPFHRLDKDYMGFGYSVEIPGFLTLLIADFGTFIWLQLKPILMLKFIISHDLLKKKKRPNLYI